MQQQNKILAQSSRWLVISVRVFDDYYTDTDTVWNSMHITQPKKSEERKNARERESERWKWKGRYSIGVSVVWALLKKKNRIDHAKAWLRTRQNHQTNCTNALRQRSQWTCELLCGALRAFIAFRLVGILVEFACFSDHQTFWPVWPRSNLLHNYTQNYIDGADQFSISGCTALHNSNKAKKDAMCVRWWSDLCRL